MYFKNIIFRANFPQSIHKSRLRLSGALVPAAFQPPFSILQNKIATRFFFRVYSEILLHFIKMLMKLRLTQISFLLFAAMIS